MRSAGLLIARLTWPAVTLGLLCCVQTARAADSSNPLICTPVPDVRRFVCVPRVLYEANRQGPAAPSKVSPTLHLYLTALRSLPDLRDPRAGLLMLGQISAAALSPIGLQQLEASFASNKAAGRSRAAVGDLLQIAAFHMRTGEYPRALERHDEALAISREAKDPEAEAATLANASVLLALRGDYAAAVADAGKAIEAFRALAQGAQVPSGRPDRSLRQSVGRAMREQGIRSGLEMTLVNRGAVQAHLGQYDQALADLQTALALYPKGDAPEGAGAVLSALAAVALRGGQAQQAQEYAARAQRAGEPEYLSEMANQGLAGRIELRAAAVAAASGQATPVQPPVQGQRPPNATSSAAQVAPVASVALEQFESEGSGLEKAGNLRGAAAAWAMAGLLAEAASVADSIRAALAGQQRVAAQLVERDLAIYFGKRGVNSMQQQRSALQGMGREVQRSFAATARQVYEGLASTLLDAGRHAEAERAMALLREDDIGDLVSPSGSMPLSQAEKALERRHLELVQRWRVLDTERAAILRQTPYLPQVVDPSMVGLLEAKTLDAHERAIVAAESTVRPSDPVSYAALSRQLATIEADLVRMRSVRSCGPSDDTKGRVNDLLARLAKLRVAGASGRPPLQASPVPSPTSLDSAFIPMARLACIEQEKRQLERAASVPDAALLAALGARPQVFGAPEAIDLEAARAALKSLGAGAVSLHYLVTAQSVRLLVVTPSERRAYRVEADRRDVNALIDQFRAALASPRADPTSTAQRLYRMLVQPAAGELERMRARVVQVSLDGRLRYLPFSALHDGQRWLVERFAFVSSIPGASGGSDKRQPRPLRVAGFGSSTGGAGLSPLPGVRDELRAIVNDGTPGAGGIVPGIVKLDVEFTLAALREALSRDFSVLHIASHFALDPAAAGESFLLLGNGATLSLKAIHEGGLDFNGIDLVALSACETGLDAQSSFGQEFDGLAAVLRRRGATNVMSSLWPVSDDSTARLMEQFYRERLAGGRPFADALRRAQLALIRGIAAGSVLSDDTVRAAVPESSSAATAPQRARPFAHPFYWAPFVLAGTPG